MTEVPKIFTLKRLAYDVANENDGEAIGVGCYYIRGGDRDQVLLVDEDFDKIWTTKTDFDRLLKYKMKAGTDSPKLIVSVSSRSQGCYWHRTNGPAYERNTNLGSWKDRWFINGNRVILNYFFKEEHYCNDEIIRGVLDIDKINQMQAWSWFNPVTIVAAKCGKVVTLDNIK
jgi:hypothetical protein